MPHPPSRPCLYAPDRATLATSPCYATSTHPPCAHEVGDLYPHSQGHPHRHDKQAGVGTHDDLGSTGSLEGARQEVRQEGGGDWWYA